MEYHNGNMEMSGVNGSYTWSVMDASSKKIAIILPSKNYTTQGPILWYANQVYLKEGFDTLQLQYSFQELDDQKISSINDWIVSFLQSQDYDSIHFISIGLGSKITAYFLTHQVYPNVKTVWFSPYIHDAIVCDALLSRSNTGLVFLGENGELIQEENVQLLEEQKHLTVAHVAGANDLLESDLDIEINVSIISTLVQILKQYIQSGKILLNEEKTKLYIYFSLYGDQFPLEEVTEKLQLQPTKTYKKGEEIIPPLGRINPYSNPRIRRYYQETCWELSTNEVESTDLEEQMTRFIGKFRDKVFIINELREKYNLKSHIQAVLHVEDGEMPILTMNKKIIQFAHQIQTEYIDFDTYVMPFDENLRFESDGINFKNRKL